MIYFVCDAVRKNSNVLVRRYLYGVAVSELPTHKPDYTEEDHVQYITKTVRKRLKARKKDLSKISLHIYKASYKNVVKSGIDFETFHPPGFSITNANPFPRGKDTSSTAYKSRKRNFFA